MRRLTHEVGRSLLDGEKYVGSPSMAKRKSADAPADAPSADAPAAGVAEGAAETPWLGAGVPHACELLLVEALHAAVGGGIRGDLAEEHALVSERSHIGEAVAAVGEHHGEVAHHAAGLVAHGPGVHGEPAHEAVREADGVGQTAEQGAAGARGQARHVAGDFHPRKRRSSVHPHGDLLELGL